MRVWWDRPDQDRTEEKKARVQCLMQSGSSFQNRQPNPSSIYACACLYSIAHGRRHLICLEWGFPQNPAPRLACVGLTKRLRCSATELPNCTCLPRYMYVGPTTPLAKEWSELFMAKSLRGLGSTVMVTLILQAQMWTNYHDSNTLWLYI